MSLKYRIAATIFVLEAVMIAALLAQTHSRFQETTRTHLEEAESVVLHLLQGVGRTALLTEEFAAMQSHLDQVGEDDRVLRAMLADHRGVVVASLDPSDIGRPLPEPTGDASRFWRRVSISTTTGELGAVAVEFSNAPLTEASSRIRRQAVAIAAIGMSLIAVVGVAIGAFLTRRLDRVSDAARKLATGDLTARSAVQGSDEIGRLGQTFDSMASALTESFEHYRSLVENAPISIHEMDRKGRVLSMNQAGRRMMGISEVLETSFFELVDPDDCSVARDALQRAIGGEPAEFQFSRTEKGATKSFQSGFYPILDPSGEVVELLGLAQDVTERRRAREALEATNEQLRQAQKMEAIGLLAGGVAHDFNNILTVISGCSQLMLSQEDLPQRDRVTEISRAAQRAASLTQQLLAFSRRQVLQPRVMDLNAALTETQTMLSRVIGENIELVTHLESELGNVKADPGQIQQVIVNLALNARDALPKGGRLSLTTRNVELDPDGESPRREDLKPGAYVALVATDNGIGMTPEVMAHIFEPFYTTKEDEGTGLGLATVYGIVKQSGGFIYVSSEPGKGSTFEILLPRVSGEVTPPKRFTTSLHEGDGTLLVVEDDDAVRALTREILVGGGYDVLEAHDGHSALRLLEERGGTIQLMITDLVMPNMGGAELASSVAASHPEVKILFTTGYAGGAPPDTLGSEALLLKKPFTATGLLEKVGEVLDSPPVAG